MNGTIALIMGAIVFLVTHKGACLFKHNIDISGLLTYNE